MLCKSCGVRWVQAHGLCRTCGRTAGDTRSNFERERDRVNGADSRPTTRVEHANAPPRSITLGGVEYLVTWDGSDGSPVGGYR